MSNGEGASRAGESAMKRRTDSILRLSSLLSAATSGFGRGVGRGRWRGGVGRFRRAGARGIGASGAPGHRSAREYGSGGPIESSEEGSTAREDGEVSGIGWSVDRGGTRGGLLWCVGVEGVSEPREAW